MASVVALLGGLGALALHVPASARAQRIPVLTRNGVGEFQPARGVGFLGWEQNTERAPNHYDVYARKDGGSRFKVNAPGTQAAMGGIQGNFIVYQQFQGSSSDIKYFNLVTKKRTSPRIFINTRRWEYWPSMSGPWVLFGRRNSKATQRKVILYNRDKQTSRLLDRVGSTTQFIAPGQVNGNWAVWYRCKPLDKCNVFRYNIESRTTKKIPNPDNANQHAPSVTSDGVVYFSKGHRGCGNTVHIMRYRDGKGSTMLTLLHHGLDVGDSYAVTNAAQTSTAIYYEQFRCGKKTASDVYKLLS